MNYTEGATNPEASTLGRMEQALAAAAQSVDSLVQRIAPMLSPEPPSPAVAGTGAKDVEPATSEINRAIRSWTQKLRLMAAHLDRVGQRIDLP